MDGGRQNKNNGESAVAASHGRADEKTRGISTLAVHAGEPRPKFGNALATPIIQTATYTFLDTRELRDHFERRIEREEYGRYGNPTQHIAEQKLAALEGAGDCLALRQRHGRGYDDLVRRAFTQFPCRRNG